jgi:uroporphyrin-III C-methyltransferase/precorrin-2 dehydrogenase/sirohydrochlorin ferrochelatase/uroporphyrin-III C-methyltransferase
MTLRAHQLITSFADIVIYDRLIPKDIIDLIPIGVERVYAGKSCRQHVMTQDEINEMLVEEANSGKVVVRLKGGDPFIFGRGGEEVAHLILNNIPFEVIPGVNAADGCSAYQGIPLTHRGVASGVRFITGHQQKGEPVNTDWQSIACEDTTLVFYMGLVHLEDICNNLINGGLNKNTPAAVIQEGTTKNERVCFSTLEHLYNDATKLGFKAPTLTIIGKVVGLSYKNKGRIIS